MNCLGRMEQRMVFERLVIGLEEPILVKGVGEFQAKIDSGNGGYNVIHGTDAYQEGEMLHFHTVDSQGNPKHVASKIVDRIQVNIGGGHIQDRPVINLDVKFANTLYKAIPFSVTDRSDNDLKVLICKSFVDNELDALIDVGEKNISGDNKQVEVVSEAKGAGILGAVKGGVDGAIDMVGKGLGKVAKFNPNSIFKKVADASDQIRKGEYQGSLLFAPVSFVAGLTAGLVDNKYLRKLGWSGAVLAAALSFTPATIVLGAGYGIYKLATMNSRYKRSYVGPAEARRLRNQYKDLKDTCKKAYKEISEKPSLLVDDRAQIKNDLNGKEGRGHEIASHAPERGITGLRVGAGNEEVVTVFDYTGSKGDGKDIAGDEYLNRFRAMAQAGQALDKKDIYKRMDGGASESEEVIVEDAASRMLLEASMEGFLVEDTEEPLNVEITGEESGDGKPAEDNPKEETPGPDDEKVKKQVKEFEEKMLEQGRKLEKFIDDYLVKKRQFILYYVDVIPTGTQTLQKEVLQGTKLDRDMANILKVTDKLDLKIFTPLVKRMAAHLRETSVKGKERFGYFALCHGKRGERKLDIFTEDECLVVSGGIDSRKIWDAVKDIKEDELEKAFGRMFPESTGGLTDDERDEVAETLGSIDEPTAGDFFEMFKGVLLGDLFNAKIPGEDKMRALLPRQNDK